MDFDSESANLVSACYFEEVSLACITEVRKTEPFGLFAIIIAGTYNHNTIN